MRSLWITVLAVAGCGGHRSDDDRKVVPTEPAVAVEAVEAVEPVEAVGKAPAKGCAKISVAVVHAGLWMSTGPKGECFAARQGASLDVAWLDAELKSALGRGCVASATVSGAREAKYQDVIAVMETATKAGITNIAIASMDEMPVAFGFDEAKAAKHCPPPVVDPNAKPVVTRTAPPSANDSVTFTRSADGKSLEAQVPLPAGQDLSKAPVVAITTTEVLLGNKVIARVSDVARGSGRLEALVAALPAKPTDATIVVQADQNTDMKVMVRVIDTVKAAGYDKVVFAVKTK